MPAPHYADLPTATRHYIDEASWNAIKTRLDALGQTGLPAFLSLPTTTKPYVDPPSWDALADAIVVAGIEGSAALNFGVIEDGSIATLTITVTGAAVGRPVAAGWPATLEAGLMGMMFVSAADTVTVRLMNRSGDTINPASQTFKAIVY